MVRRGHRDLPDYPRALAPRPPPPTGHEAKGRSLPIGPLAPSPRAALVRAIILSLQVQQEAPPSSCRLRSCCLTTARDHGAAGPCWSAHPSVSHLGSKHSFSFLVSGPLDPAVSSVPSALPLPSLLFGQSCAQPALLHPSVPSAWWASTLP